MHPKKMNDARPFLNDIKEKTADELVEMYSFIIRRAINSKDETFVPELNGTIKNTTLRLLELGFEINSVYEKFIKENNERQKREIIEIYDKETNEKLSECVKINELLSSTKKKRRKSEYSAVEERVKLFVYGNEIQIRLHLQEILVVILTLRPIMITTFKCQKKVNHRMILMKLSHVKQKMRKI